MLRISMRFLLKDFIYKLNTKPLNSELQFGSFELPGAVVVVWVVAVDVVVDDVVVVDVVIIDVVVEEVVFVEIFVVAVVVLINVVVVVISSNYVFRIIDNLLISQYY